MGIKIAGLFSMKFFIILIILGCSLLAYSLTMKPFSDEQLFHQKYSELGHGPSNEYFELYRSMLTSKYRLQDTGITLTSLGILSILMIKRGDGVIRSPKSKAGYWLLAITLSFVTVSGYVFDILQGYHRLEFPHWADSLAIPLFPAPVILILLLLFSIAHLRFLNGYEITSQMIRLSKEINIWLIFVSLITALMVVESFVHGEYWYILPGIMWIPVVHLGDGDF